MNITKGKAVTFTDLHFANISIPADRVPLYAMFKADQLTILNRILSDHASGFNLSLSENDVAMLSGLASELAHVSCNLVSTLTEEARYAA